MDKYETFWRRVVAAIVDSIILYIITYIVSFAFISTNVIPALIVWAIVGFIWAFYDIFLHYRYGQTIGKMVTGVKVLDDSETPISLGQSILRSLPQLLTPLFAVSFSTAGESTRESVQIWGTVIYGFTCLFDVLSAIVCLTSTKRRALHDFIAGTVVVRTDI